MLYTMLKLCTGGSFAIIGYDFSRPHPDHPQVLVLMMLLIKLDISFAMDINIVIDQT